MTTAQITGEILAKRTEGTGEARPLKGRDLSELLAKVAIDRDLAQTDSVRDELEVEATYEIGTELWTVQLYNRTTCKGKSLYELNQV